MHAIRLLLDLSQVRR